MLKFKIGDKVRIIAGKDKGREGTIEKILPDIARAIIPGINEYKKHMKAQSGQKGGIIPIPRAMAFSKMKLICPNCLKEVKIGFRLAGKEKVRYCKKCGKEIMAKK
jgi:large subunit ribosomal protein L24